MDLLGSGEASPESLKEFFEMLLDGPANSLGVVIVRLAKFLVPVLSNEEAMLHWSPVKKWHA